MIKALFLIFEPGGAWERVVEARRGPTFIFIFYLLPMLLIVSAAEGFGLAHSGTLQMNSGVMKKLTVNEAVVFETAQSFLTLLVIAASAYFIKSLGETFHSRHNYTQAFTVVVYGLSPLFLFRLFDAFPLTNPWITWALGIVLSVSVIYQGVPRVMAPDPTHAFGLYLVSSMVLLLATFLARMFTAFYLSGTINFQHSFLSHLLGR